MLHTEPTTSSPAPMQQQPPTWALVAGAFVILFIRPYPNPSDVERVVFLLFLLPLFAFPVGLTIYGIERARGNKKARFTRAYAAALALLAVVQFLGVWLF